MISARKSGGSRAFARWSLLCLLAIGLLATAAPGTALGAYPSGKLTISPAPDTPDANPATQISILGVAPKKIKSVTATGAESGAHIGQIQAYSGKRGASFVPAQAFTQGESVAVRVKLAGRAPIDFSFTVARLGPTPGTLS